MSSFEPYVIKANPDGSCPKGYCKCGSREETPISPTVPQTTVVYGLTYIKETMGPWLVKTTRYSYSVNRNAADDGWEISVVEEYEENDRGVTTKRTKFYPKDYSAGTDKPDKAFFSDVEVERGIFNSSGTTYDFEFTHFGFAHNGPDFEKYLTEMSESYGDEVTHVDRTFVVLGQKTLASKGSDSEAARLFTLFLEESRTGGGETRNYVYQTPIASDVSKDYLIHYAVTVNGVEYDTRFYQSNTQGYNPILMPYDNWEDIGDSTVDNFQEAIYLIVKKSALNGKTANDFAPKDGKTRT